MNLLQCSEMSVGCSQETQVLTTVLVPINYIKESITFEFQFPSL